MKLQLPLEPAARSGWYPVNAAATAPGQSPLQPTRPSPLPPGQRSSASPRARRLDRPLNSPAENPLLTASTCVARPEWQMQGLSGCRTASPALPSDRPPRPTAPPATTTGGAQPTAPLITTPTAPCAGFGHNRRRRSKSERLRPRMPQAGVLPDSPVRGHQQIIHQQALPTADEKWVAPECCVY